MTAEGAHRIGLKLTLVQRAIVCAGYCELCPRAHPVEETREHRRFNRGAGSFAAPCSNRQLSRFFFCRMHLRVRYSIVRAMDESSRQNVEGASHLYEHLERP